MLCFMRIFQFFNSNKTKYERNGFASFRKQQIQDSLLVHVTHEKSPLYLIRLLLMHCLYSRAAKTMFTTRSWLELQEMQDEVILLANDSWL